MLQADSKAILHRLQQQLNDTSQQHEHAMATTQQELSHLQQELQAALTDRDRARQQLQQALAAQQRSRDSETKALTITQQQLADAHKLNDTLQQRVGELEVAAARLEARAITAENQAAALAGSDISLQLRAFQDQMKSQAAELAEARQLKKQAEQVLAVTFKQLPHDCPWVPKDCVLKHAPTSNC